ncbi:MAG: HAD family phosphatase [Clostridia bacterium]|nr:HAD family phosphatase [Clostridia bacterium]
MKIYLFDFDGTLVDSMPTYGGLMLRILSEQGVEYPADVIKIITPLGFVGTARYFIQELGVRETEDALIATMVEYAVDAYTHRVPAKANVVSVLHRLKEQGASLNVLTASPHDTLDPCLKRLGIWELFDHVWSCNDFQTTKADPNIYRMAAERLGASVEDVIFLDDNYNADVTAKKAGMQVYGVYDESSAEYETEIRSVTDRYITDFSELLTD